MAKINGRLASWDDFSADGGWGDITELLSLDWSEDQDVAARYGKGSKPIGHSVGNWKGTGKMELTLEGYRRAKAQAKKQGYDSLLATPPRTITGVYELKGEDATHTVTLKGCVFNKTDGGSKQGDTEVKRTLEFVITEGIDEE